MSTPALKRKRNDDNHYPDVETPQTTKELGLKIVTQLKRAQDKTGRDVATHFLDLPDREDYPDYYRQIAMPISLNMIEDRLHQETYNNMLQVEGDLKRMVQNAKDYNDSRSEVFLDAERIRKALSNFMPKHNPAYQDPEYRAVPTPVPQALLDRMRESSVSTSGTGPVKLVLKSRQSTGPPTDREDDIQDKFVAVIDELSIRDNAINFEKRPPKRDYPDYYRIIAQPTSISDVRAMVRQKKIGDWNSLAKEVRLIWENAKEYNEPESDIYSMTEELETWFEDRIQAEGADPPRKGPRLSLSQPKRPGIKLKLGTSTPTPAITGGTVDNESLRRQKEEMSQALNRSHRDISRGVVVSTPTVSTAPSMRRSMSSIEPNDVVMTGMNGDGAGQHPSGSESGRVSLPSGTRQLPTSVMDGMPPSLATNGVRPDSSYQAPTRNIFVESDNPIDRKHRDPGKGIQDALVESVVYMTHPNLPGDPKWKLTRFASPDKTQTVGYIYLPSTHYYFRVVPALSRELKSRSNWKVCVAANWQTVPESPHVPGAYDFRLQPGENSIIVDVIADLKRGEKKDYAPPQMQFDFERIQLVVLLVDRSAE